MRGKFLFLCLVLAAVFCLCSCTRVINSPADELRMYSWSCETDNGNTASLSFDEGKCSFIVTADGFELDLCGLCVFDDDRLIICDENSGINYSFEYHLYGDRVELSCNGSKLTFKKNSV